MATLTLLPTTSTASTECSNNGNNVIIPASITTANLEAMDEGYDSADSTAGIQLNADGAPEGYGILKLYPSGGSYPSDFAWALVTNVNVRVRFRTVSRVDDSGEWRCCFGIIPQWTTGGTGYPVGGTYPIGAWRMMNMATSSSWTGVFTGPTAVSGITAPGFPDYPVFMFDVDNYSQNMAKDGLYGEIDACDVVLTYTPAVPATWVSGHYRFYDESDIDAPTALAAEDTNISRTVSNPFILVMNAGESADANIGNTGGFTLYQRVNGGGWVPVDDISGAARLVASAANTDQQNFNNLLSAITGVATQQQTWNEFFETAAAGPASRTWTDDSAEYAFSLSLDSGTVTNGDTIEFSFLAPDGTTRVPASGYPMVTVGTGGTQYNENHTFSGTGTASTPLKQVGLVKSYAGTGTSALTKLLSLAKSFAYSGTGTSALTKATSFLRSYVYSGTGTPTLAKGKFFDRTFSFSGVGSSAFARALTRVRSFSYTGTGTSTVERIVGKLLSYAGTGSVATALQQVLSRTFSFTGSGSSLLERSATYLRSLDYSGVGTSALTYGKSYLRSFTYSATGASAFAKAASYLRSLVYTGTGGASLTLTSTFVRSLNYAGTGTSNLLKEVGLSLVYSATGSLATLTQKVKLLALSFTGTGSALLTKSHSYLKSLTYSALGTISLERSLSKLLNYGATGTSALLKAGTFLRSFAYSATGTLVTATQKVKLVVLAYSATGSAQISKSVGKVLAYTGAGTSALLKSISISLQYTATGTSTALKSIGKAFAYAASGAVSFAKDFISGVNDIVRSFAASGTAALTFVVTYVENFTYTGTATTTLQKAVSKLLSFSAGATSSLTRGISKSFSFVATGTATLAESLIVPVVRAFSAAGSVILATLTIPFTPGAFAGRVRRVMSRLGRIGRR